MSGISVAGGGSVEVDTAPMLAAAAALDRAEGELTALVRALSGLTTGRAAGDLRAAEDHARAAQGCCAQAAAGLRLAGVRYGLIEEGVTRGVHAAAAADAALLGAALRVAPMLGPGAPMLVAAGAVVAGAGLLLAAGTQALALGRVAPQLDPRDLEAGRTALASADDVARGLLGMERPSDVLADDPAAPLGSQAIAGGMAAVLGAPSDSVAVRQVFRPLPAPAPTGLGELADRVPPAGEAEPQVHLERYDDPDGRRWIVYITGTVTFAGDGGREPFDMRSNLQGVADRPAASGTAATEAMRAAGVRPDEPVLLVGHSQGALDAVRIAQHGGFRVEGVVTLGGPTGQIALPSVPVLAVEHVEDPVPALGGAAAMGAAGRARIVVRRCLYSRADPPPVTGVPSHALERYAETLHQVERSPEPRLVAFRRRIAPFLAARSGTATDYRAERVPVRVTPSRDQPAAAARGR